MISGEESFRCFRNFWSQFLYFTIRRWVKFWISSMNPLMCRDVSAPKLYAGNMELKLNRIHSCGIMCLLNHVGRSYEFPNYTHTHKKKNCWSLLESSEYSPGNCKKNHSSLPSFFSSLLPSLYLSFHPPPFPSSPLPPSFRAERSFCCRIRLSFTDLGDILENLKFWYVTPTLALNFYGFKFH